DREAGPFGGTGAAGAGEVGQSASEGACLVDPARIGRAGGRASRAGAAGSGRGSSRAGGPGVGTISTQAGRAARVHGGRRRPASAIPARADTWAVEGTAKVASPGPYCGHPREGSVVSLCGSELGGRFGGALPTNDARAERSGDDPGAGVDGR